MQKLMTRAAERNLLTNLIKKTDSITASEDYTDSQVQDMFNAINDKFVDGNDEDLLDEADEHFDIEDSDVINEWSEQFHLTKTHKKIQPYLAKGYMVLFITGHQSQIAFSFYVPDADDVNSVANYLLKKIK